jgi:GT2 family glycosyltransferase
MDQPLVAALLLNWRLADLTLACWNDLRACSYRPLHVLVMDNGSGDGSAERLRAAIAAAEGEAEAEAEAEAEGGGRASRTADPVPSELPGRAEGAERVARREQAAGIDGGLRSAAIAFDENLGYCAAMNRGIAWARQRGAELVLFLNNDMRLPPGFLQPLVDVLRHDPDAAGVAPTILDPTGRVWCEGAMVAFHPNMLWMRRQGRAPTPTTEGPMAVDFLPGACALYRTADLAVVGDLDADYFMYWEDVELGWRLRNRLGKKLLWLPWTRVTHLSSASSGGGRSPLRKYMSGVNSVRYLRRHGTLRQWCAFALFECALWPLTWLSGTPWRAVLAKGRGIGAGLAGRRVTAADVARWG